MQKTYDDKLHSSRSSQSEGIGSTFSKTISVYNISSVSVCSLKLANLCGNTVEMSLVGLYLDRFLCKE